MMFAISIGLEGIFHAPISTVILRGVHFVMKLIGFFVVTRRHILDPMSSRRRAVSVERLVLLLVTARIHC